MKIYWLQILLIFLLSSCGKEGLPAGHRGEAFLLSDNEKQELVLQEMRKNKIPFEIDDDGYVNFLLDDQAKVHGILRKVEYGEELKGNAFETTVLIDKNEREAYESAFKDENIPYRVFSEEGVVHIEWNQKYGPQVDIVRQKIDKKILDDLIRQIN